MAIFRISGNLLNTPVITTITLTEDDVEYTQLTLPESGTIIKFSGESSSKVVRLPHPSYNPGHKLIISKAGFSEKTVYIDSNFIKGNKILIGDGIVYTALNSSFGIYSSSDPVFNDDTITLVSDGFYWIITEMTQGWFNTYP